MRPTFHRLVTGVAVLAAAGLIAAGCGTGGGGTSGSAGTTPILTTAPVNPTAALTVKSPADASQAHASSIVVAGTSEPGASITVENGGRQSMATVTPSGKWHTQAHLAVGDNTLTITAAKAGFTDSVPATLNVTRSLTAAEKAAAEAIFKASTSSIPYNALLKDSGPFVGKAVQFTGQVFQIQQSGNSGGNMLLAVTDQGYGYWSDNVWVDYDSSTPANKGDMVTVYGKVTGSKSYDTQIGGNTYVPQIRARYIDVGGTNTSTPPTSQTSTPTTPHPTTSPAGNTGCDQNISAGPGTSCGLAANVFRAYAADYQANGEQSSNSVNALSTRSRKSYSMTCTNDGTTVNCAGADNAFVTFPIQAVKVY